MQNRKTAALIELHYFPSIAWFSVLKNSSDLQIEDGEHYQKGSFRNRCQVAGPEGVRRLSVPLRKGKHQQCPVREVRIAYDEPWPRVHERTLLACYGSAPFFEHYAELFLPILHKNHPFLFDLNVDILQSVLHCLPLTRQNLTYDSGYAHQNDREREDLRGVLQPNRSPPAHPLISEPVPYVQVFADRNGFLPNLSILDLIFCTGPEAVRYL